MRGVNCQLMDEYNNHVANEYHHHFRNKFTIVQFRYEFMCISTIYNLHTSFARATAITIWHKNSHEYFFISFTDANLSYIMK